MQAGYPEVASSEIVQSGSRRCHDNRKATGRRAILRAGCNGPRSFPVIEPDSAPGFVALVSPFSIISKRSSPSRVRSAAPFGAPLTAPGRFGASSSKGETARFGPAANVTLAGGKIAVHYIRSQSVRLPRTRLLAHGAGSTSTHRALNVQFTASQPRLSQAPRFMYLSRGVADKRAWNRFLLCYCGSALNGRCVICAYPPAAADLEATRASNGPFHPTKASRLQRQCRRGIGLPVPGSVAGEICRFSLCALDCTARLAKTTQRCRRGRFRYL